MIIRFGSRYRVNRVVQRGKRPTPYFKVMSVKFVYAKILIPALDQHSHHVPPTLPQFGWEHILLVPNLEKWNHHLIKNLQLQLISKSTNFLGIFSDKIKTCYVNSDHHCCLRDLYSELCLSCQFSKDIVRSCQAVDQIFG